jgi:hypothetical protein
MLVQLAGGTELAPQALVSVPAELLEQCAVVSEYEH